MSAHHDDIANEKPRAKATSKEQAELEEEARGPRPPDWRLPVIIVSAMLLSIVVILAAALLPGYFEDSRPHSVVISSSEGEAYDIGELLDEYKETLAEFQSQLSEDPDATVYGDSGWVPNSTKERTPLPPSFAQGTEYLTDEDGTHIEHPLVLEQKLLSFYGKTGVKPYLYILSEDTPYKGNSIEFVQKGNSLYDELFDDEGHLLMLFRPNGGDWECMFFMGDKARVVMDEEAQEILSDYLIRNLRLTGVPLEDIFGFAFTKTADRIMGDPIDPLDSLEVVALFIMGIGALVVVIAVVRIAVLRHRSRREAKQAELERMEQILQLPLDRLDDESDPSSAGTAASIMARARKQERHWVSAVIVAAGIIAIGALVFLIPSSQSDSPIPITASTIARTPLSAEVDLDVEYYTDEQGDYFTEPQKLEEGLREFYVKTGVRSYVYVKSEDEPLLTEDVVREVAAACEGTFGGEPYLILICVDTPYRQSLFRYVGNGAESIMDEQATSILADYVDLYSLDYTSTNDEIFGSAFASTADRILGKTSPTSTKFIIAGIIVVAIAVAAILIVRKLRWDKQAVEQEKAHRLRRFLKHTPLRRFADTELDELEQKYRRKPKRTAKKSKE